MNLPNSLTVMRIFLVPLLVVVLLTQFEGRQIFGVRKEIVGAAIFGLASFTDWADGYLARRRQQVTPFGQFIDPLADKLLILGALISLVQMNALELHPWGARADSLEKPDRIVFDFDPGDDVEWSAVKTAARDVRDVLSEAGLTSFLRTSGGKGLHVVVPIARRNSS